MQLIVKGGIVVATHADGVISDLVAAYGEGATSRALPAGQPVPALGDEAPPVDLRAYAAQARYARETAGVVVGTAPVATDRDSQALITGMWAAAQIDPQIQVAFKSGSGFVTIGADKVGKIAAAVVNHVQACFSAEAQVVADIAAGKVKTEADVDAAFAVVG